jgi:hypothetical protein
LFANIVRQQQEDDGLCMMVYIGASQPLEQIPWNEATPAFYVGELHESEVTVRAQFDATYVYYAGSHEGRGCGFQYGQYPEFEDVERHLKRASLDAFSDYLAGQFDRVDTIELYACWDGIKPPAQSTGEP